MNLCYYRYIPIGFVAAFALIVAVLDGDLFANPCVSVLVGAGDIASCEHDLAEATAKLLDKIAGTVVTAGDNAYSSGAERRLAQC